MDKFSVLDPKSGMRLPSFFLSDKEKTFQYDESCPPLPVPPLQQTLRKYLDSVKPLVSAEEFQQTQAIVDKFAKEEGKELHRKLLEHAKNKKNWLHQWWEDYAYMYNREPHSPQVNFAGPAPYAMNYWPPEEGSQLPRGGILMWGNVKYWQILRKEMLAVDRGGIKEKSVWSMDQFRRMFNSCKLPGEHLDTFTFNFKTESEGPCASHIVILHKGRMFSFNAVDGEGEPLTPLEYEIQLRYIIDKCKGLPEGPGLGQLTGHRRPEWYKAREHLIQLDKKNLENLEVLQTSIFCAVLDENEPKTITDLSTAGLLGDAKNRWFDKNMCHILFKNGVSASNCDHAPHDAMIMVSSTLWNFLTIQLNDLEWKGTKDIRNFPPPEELVFTLDSKMHVYLEEAQRVFQNSVDSIEILTDHYTGYGRKWLRSMKVHPDTHIQIAGQYAYYRIYGKPAPTYETASTRKFYRARTETLRSCTMEALAFSKAMMNEETSKEDRLKLLLKAYEKHSNLMAECQNGMGCDRHLFGLQILAAEEGLPVPEIFTDPAFKKSGGGGNYIMSTSFVGYTECFGGVAPMCKNGYGYFYSIQNDQVNYWLSTWTADATTSAKLMFDTASKCLDDMRELLEYKASKSSTTSSQL